MEVFGHRSGLHPDGTTVKAQFAIRPGGLRLIGAIVPFERHGHCAPAYIRRSLCRSGRGKQDTECGRRESAGRSAGLPADGQFLLLLALSLLAAYGEHGRQLSYPLLRLELCRVRTWPTTDSHFFSFANASAMALGVQEPAACSKVLSPSRGTLRMVLRSGNGPSAFGHHCGIDAWNSLGSGKMPHRSL